LCLLSSLLFFFYAYVDLRHLHSFPTRRSSDLAVCAHADTHSPRIARNRDGDRIACSIVAWGRVRPPRRSIPAPQRRHGPGRGLRSEEHTSELQSLAYLVCRLLLEKKKQTYTTH